MSEPLSETPGSETQSLPRYRIGVLAFALLFVAGILYSLFFSVNKLATSNGVPAVGYVFWHSLGAGLFLLSACAARRDLPKLDWAHLRFYFIGGAIGIAFPVSVLAYVAPNLPASIVVIVTVLVPMLTYLLALSVRLERFRLLCLVGLLIGLGGIMMLVVPGASLPTFEMVHWVLLALLGPVLFAAFNVFAAVKWPGNSNSLPLACGIQLGAMVILIPIMFATGQSYIFPGPSLDGDLAILWASLLNMVIWVLVFEIIRIAGPVFLSQFTYIIVLSGFGWGALIFGETINAFAGGAAALLFIGLALLTIGKRAPRAKASSAD